MSEIAARWVTVYPKIATGFSSEINAAVSKGAAQGGKAVGDGIEKGTKEAAPRVGSIFKSVVAPVLTLSAVGAVAGFVKKSVDAFSELEDATGAAGVIFGESMDKIITKSETAAATLGMSKAQVIDAANTFGTLGKSANLSGDDLADFSNEMTDVAGSLSSFKGGSPEEAILAVGAALRGESEPIRRYGVLLDDATLRAQALKMGLISTTKEALTPQQRVLAAQQQILAQSSDAMGDFTRTADSTANVQKRLAAESANLQAEIGQKLAPAIVEAQKAGIGFLQFVTANQEAIIPLVKTVGALTLAIGGFVAVSKGIEALKAARATIQGLGDAFQQMGTKAKIATASAGAIGIALTAAAAIYGVFAQKNAEAKAAVEDYTQALEADNGALGENVRLMVAKRLEQEGALKSGQMLGISSADLTSAVLGEADALQRVRDRSYEVVEAYHLRGEGTVEQLRAAEAVLKATDEENASLQDAVGGYKRVAGAAQETVTATTKVTAAATGGKIAFDDYNKAIKETYNVQLQLRGGHRAVEAAIDSAAEAVKKNGKNLDINTAKGRANQEALDGIASSWLSTYSAMSDADKQSAKTAKEQDRVRDSFIKTATAMGMSKKEAKELADKLGLIKSKKVTVQATVNLKKGSGVTYTAAVSVDGTGQGKWTLKAAGGPARGGIRGRDSIPSLLMPDEHVLTVEDVQNLGGHEGVFKMRALARQGVLRFAAGGPVAPTYKGHSLDWWEDYLLSEREMVQLQIRIKDLKADLKARETYNPPGKRKKAKRDKLRGLERKEAQLELKEAEEQLRLAKDAAAANSSKQGTIRERMERFEAQQQASEDAASLWRQAASTLGKSNGLGSLDKVFTQHTNAMGESWSTSREVTAADLAARVGEQANQVATFIDLLDQLRKAGASEALISDVMALGTVEGTKAARLYLADRKSLAIAESAYAQLAASQARLGAIGTAVGAAAVQVTINEAATPEATKNAVVNGILMART